MKTKYVTLIALAFSAFGYAQTDSIKLKTDQATQVRKEQNERLSGVDAPSTQSVTPATSATTTNNGSNKASGNAQPSTTPNATNTPNGTGTSNNNNNNLNPSGSPRL